MMERSRQLLDDQYVKLFSSEVSTPVLTRRSRRARAPQSGGGDHRRLKLDPKVAMSSTIRGMVDAAMGLCLPC